MVVHPIVAHHIILYAQVAPATDVPLADSHIHTLLKPSPSDQVVQPHLQPSEHSWNAKRRHIMSRLPYKPASRRVCVNDDDSGDDRSGENAAVPLTHEAVRYPPSQTALSDTPSRRHRRLRRTKATTKSDSSGRPVDTRARSCKGPTPRVEDETPRSSGSVLCRAAPVLTSQSLASCRSGNSSSTKQAVGLVDRAKKPDQVHDLVRPTSSRRDTLTDVRNDSRFTKSKHSAITHDAPETGHDFLAKVDSSCFVQSSRTSIVRSRTRPSRQTRRRHQRTGKVTFLSLPGEVRNQIYSLLIPRMRVLICSNRPNKEQKVEKSLWCNANTVQVRPRFRLSHIVDTCQMEQGLAITTDLLLACQEVRTDIETFLYARTTFCFTSAKVIQRFVSRASPSGLEAIEKLEINQAGYNHPRLLNDDVYRQKYYSSWARACDRAGQAMLHLQSIYLRVEIFDRPLDSDSDLEDLIWKHGLIKLAPRRVEKVHASLSHRMLSRDVARDIAHRLEDCMMTETGRHRRDEAETRQVLRQLRAQSRAAALAVRRAEQEASNLSSPQIVISAQDVLQAQQQKEASPDSKPKPVRKNLVGFSYTQGLGNHGM